MLSNISEFVKRQLDRIKPHINTIILGLLVAFLVLFSFACGYIVAKYQSREPLIIGQSKQ